MHETAKSWKQIEEEEARQRTIESKDLEIRNNIDEYLLNKADFPIAGQWSDMYPLFWRRVYNAFKQWIVLKKTREFSGMADNGFIVAVFNACADAVEEIPADEFELNMTLKAMADLQTDTPGGKAWNRIVCNVEKLCFDVRFSPKSFLLEIDDILGDYSLEYAVAWVDGEL